MRVKQILSTVFMMAFLIMSSATSLVWIFGKWEPMWVPIATIGIEVVMIVCLIAWCYDDEEKR